MSTKNNIQKPKPREPLDISLNVIFSLRIYKPFYDTKVVKDTRRETLYRTLLFVLLFIYNLQHVIFAIQSIGHMENFITVTLVLISTVNHLYKLYTFHVYRDRIENIIRVTEEPLFAPIFQKDYNLLEYNKKVIRILQKAYHFSVYLCVVLWFSAAYATRYYYGQAVIPAYFPFSLEPMTGFTIAVFYKYLVITWIGIGHVTIDCVMAGFYTQASSQIAMLKNSLERLADFDNLKDPELERRDANNKYRTILENNFVFCVRKYEKIFWYVREIESIFNKAQIVQLAMSIISLCVVLYKILGPINFDAFFLVLYYTTFLLQVFIFCYCGTLIEYESHSINYAIFSCDWTSLSPRFRKLMIFAMLRWSRPITLFTASVLPLSMNMYIRVLKLSYSLFTLLKETSE